VKTRPPGFVVMCSHPEELADSYRRYLVNGLRDHFDLPGTPIRLMLRGQGEQNPFKDRQKQRSPNRLRKHLEGRAE
jgi:GTP-binding protein